MNYKIIVAKSQEHGLQAENPCTENVFCFLLYLNFFPHMDLMH